MTAFGFLLPTREIVMNQEVPNFSQILELAEHAEALGFDSAWVGDSVLARPRFEALTTLAAVAARTQRVRLGIVVFPTLRHPVVLANEVASLDHVANGRLILGVGIGGNAPAVAREFAACGISINRRVGLFEEESLALLRRLWTEPEVTFQGRYFQLQSVRLGLRPLQKSGVPLWVAGRVDNALRRIRVSATVGCRFRHRLKRSRRIGIGSKRWDKRWGVMPASFIAVCTPRSTSTPMSRSQTGSCARS